MLFSKFKGLKVKSVIMHQHYTGFVHKIIKLSTKILLEKYLNKIK